MIQISQLSLPVDAGQKQLREKAASILGIEASAILELRVIRKSIDARKKERLQYIYTVAISTKKEEWLLQRSKTHNVTQYKTLAPYVFPQMCGEFSQRPVIVGMGPAGLFAALFLARAGASPILLERGRPVGQRSRDVEQFWRTGILNPTSNVQFGEGGAGTFSDGKLTTGTHDLRVRTVFEVLVAHGAPEDILYSHKPHVGTDVLRQVVQSIRKELLSLGCEVCFEHRLTGLITPQGALTGITVSTPEGEKQLDCDTLVLAPGHSARDSFRMLYDQGIHMEQKPFAIGVRIEHSQAAISRAQYGEVWEKVPPADYKLACHLPSGRSAFTFCVCPGGEVVAASSEEGQIVTNGMSLRAREGTRINGGFLVGVGPADFPGDDPLAGVRFQEQWERAAWELGGRNGNAPAQLVGDFLERRPSVAGGSIIPTYRPGVTWTDLRACLPEYVTDTLAEALPIFHRKVSDFADPDSVLTGVETRSSSPLRILRDSKTLMSSLHGLYPCGEGAGYAGGIVSAAVDGIRVAESVAMAEK